MVVVTVLVLVIIYFNFRATIYGVFPQSKTKVSSSQNSQNQEVVKKDTDGDGLYDFEERLDYGTSQYLADTDGDGFLDKKEVEAGSDPLNQTSTSYNKKAEGEKGQVLEKTFSNEDNKNIQESEKQVSADEIRQLLINQGGLSKEVVDNFDDKTLKSLYNETKQEFNMNLDSLEDLQNVNNLPLEGQESF